MAGLFLFLWRRLQLGGSLFGSEFEGAISYLYPGSPVIRSAQATVLILAVVRRQLFVIAGEGKRRFQRPGIVNYPAFLQIRSVQDEPPPFNHMQFRAVPRGVE